MFSSSALVIVSASCSVSRNLVKSSLDNGAHIYILVLVLHVPGMLQTILKKRKRRCIFVYQFHMWSICYAKCLLFVAKFNWGTRFCLFVCFLSFPILCSLTEDSISILLQFECRCMLFRSLVRSQETDSESTQVNNDTENRLRLSRFFVCW